MSNISQAGWCYEKNQISNDADLERSGNTDDGVCYGNDHTY